jgi:hypothetical protein
MKRIAMPTVLLILILILPGLSGPRAGESVEGVEKDLLAIIKDLDAVESEIGRIEDLGRTPKATSIRIEIFGSGAVAVPVRARLIVQGRVEEDHGWGKAERDVFAGGAAPLVLSVPFLPGTYAARVELQSPSWKASPAADVSIRLAKGQTALVRFRLAPSPGKAEPALTRLETR